MPVSATQRSVGVVVSIVVMMVASLGIVWAQLSSLADTDARTRTAALCFVIAGLAGTTGAVGAWLRTNWAAAPMIVWLAATVLGIVATDRYLHELDVLHRIDVLGWITFHGNERQPGR
jgi:hypothetical protein